MNNVKVKGFDNLEKDPTTGAVILAPSNSVVDIKIDNLIKKVKVLEKQNQEILQIVKDLQNKLNA